MSSVNSGTRSPYRLPTHPVAARLIFGGGREEEVILYLRTASEAHPGPESLDEFLKNPRQFLPVKSRSSGKSLLVQRNSIHRVEVDDNAPILSRLQAELAPSIDLVRIEMLDGAVLEGTLASILPPESMRMSDFFNLADDFIPIELEKGVTYVNKDFILMVCL